MPPDLLGMNATLMHQYIKFVMDQVMSLTGGKQTSEKTAEQIAFLRLSAQPTTSPNLVILLSQ